MEVMKKCVRIDLWIKVLDSIVSNIPLHSRPVSYFAEQIAWIDQSRMTASARASTRRILHLLARTMYCAWGNRSSYQFVRDKMGPESNTTNQKYHHWIDVVYQEVMGCHIRYEHSRDHVVGKE